MEIKNKIKTVLAAFAIVFASVFGLALPVSADSPTVVCPDGKTIKGTFENCTGATDAESRPLMGTLRTVINVVLAILAFVTVAMIIIGGINYSTSQGDSTKVTKAKNTILYGVIGLVVALLAFAIVNFVLANLFK